MSRNGTSTYAEWHRKRLNQLHRRQTPCADGERASLPACMAWWMLQAGWSCLASGDLSSAVRHCAEASQNLQSIPSRERADDLLLCLVHIDLAFASNLTGDPARALDASEQALALATRLQCQPLAWRAVAERTAARLELGHYAEIVADVRSQLARCPRSADPLEQIAEQLSLWLAHRQVGNTTEASNYLAIGRRLMRLYAAEQPAGTRALLAELARAIATSETLAPLLVRLRSAARLAAEQSILTCQPFARHPDVLRRSAHRYRQQVNRAHARGDSVLETSLRLRQATIYLALEDYSAAIQTIEAVTAFNRPQALRAMCLLGAALFLSGRHAEAAAGHLALAMRGEGEARTVEFDCMLFLSLGQALIVEGDGYRAAAYSQLALEVLDGVPVAQINGEFGHVWYGLQHAARLVLAEAQLLQVRPERAVLTLRQTRARPENIDRYGAGFRLLREQILARSYEMHKSPLDAQRHWQETRNLSEALGDSLLAIEAQCGLARACLQTGDYRSAIDLARAVYAAARVQRHDEWQMEAARVLGGAYASVREHAIAATFLMNALCLAEQLGDSCAAGDILVDLGLALGAQDQTLEAAFCLERAQRMSGSVSLSRGAEIEGYLRQWAMRDLAPAIS